MIRAAEAQTKPSLLILAAGLGTRYGGLKQIDPMGPNGEILIDYSIYDAINTGFGRLVFVIQHSFEDAFKKIGSKFDNRVETAYAYQELDSCLDGFRPPRNRDKPWGTGHAILVAADVIDGPFAVINADDYYGPGSFRTISQFLAAPPTGPGDYAMVGYTLRDTLSDCGLVARGICRCDEKMYLKQIVERKKVERTAAGARYFDDDGSEHALTGNEIVSMNLWGLQPSIFAHIRSHFKRFLSKLGGDKNAELYIPSVIDELLQIGRATVKVLRTDEAWFGVTFRRDAVTAARCIRELIKQGRYPEKLWD